MTPAGTSPSDVAADAIREAARTGAPDRYLAALLAPRAARDDLITLAAFAAEIEKITSHATEAPLGEIRIQWWRDALRDAAGGTKSGHPIADAFADVIARHNLSANALDGFFDANVHRLFADAPADDAALRLELDLIEGTLFSFVAQILGAPSNDNTSAVITEAAQAYGLAKLGLDLPYTLARGRIPLPPAHVTQSSSQPDWQQTIDSLVERARAHLAHVRTAYSTAPAHVKSALLPLALVEPYLRVLSRAGRDPARDVSGISPLTRTWRLAKSHVTGRL